MGQRSPSPLLRVDFLGRAGLICGVLDLQLFDRLRVLDYLLPLFFSQCSLDLSPQLTAEAVNFFVGIVPR